MGMKKLFRQPAPTTSQAQWQHIRWSRIKKATTNDKPTCQKEASAEYIVNGETQRLRKMQQPVQHKSPMKSKPNYKETQHSPGRNGNNSPGGKRKGGNDGSKGKWKRSKQKR
eukprot:scaffold52593_cov42-Attheya_sp.AAC.1